MRRTGWRSRIVVAAIVALTGALLMTSAAEAAVAPDSPTAVVAVRGDLRATVTWTQPGSDGGTPLIGYIVTATPGGATCSAPAPATGCTVWDLTNGVSYTFTVTAWHDAGTSQPSSPSNAVVPVAGAGAFVPLPAPRRIVDSRVGQHTDDGLYQGIGALAAGSTEQIVVAGRVGLPIDVSSVTLSVAAVTPSATGHLTVYPCDAARPSTASLNFTKGITLAGTVLTRLGSSDTHFGDVCVYASVTTHLVIDLPGSLSSTAFTPLGSPQRIIDTRPAGHTDDGEGQGAGLLRAGRTLTVEVAGRVGLEANTANAVLYVVAIGPTAPGYLTVHPCGTTRPTASSMNVTTGVTLGNTVLTKIGTGASVCIYTSTTTHLVVDVGGSFEAGTYLPLAAPKRIVDSRLNGDTDDEQQERFGALAAGSVRAIPVGGRVGLTPGAENVVLSVAAVGPSAGGYFTVYPCGRAKPTASSMNYTKGVTIADTVITKLGAGGTNAGKVCIFTSARTDVVVDVSGTLG